MKRLTCCSVATILGLATAAATTANAQIVDTAEQHYSRGVHAYFSGHGSSAEESLNQSISLDPDDPRPYYFRALNRLRRGETFAAREDMQIGAYLEAQSPGQFAVGRALERVQGGHRIRLEAFRRQARQAFKRQRREVRQRQRQQLEIRNEAVERRRVPVPLEALTGDVGVDDFPQEATPAPPETIQRQQPEIDLPTTPGEGEEPPAEEATEEIDPFGDDPAEGAEPFAPQPDETDQEATDDQPTEEQDPPPAEQEEDPDEGIFGDEEENPFGEF